MFVCLFLVISDAGACIQQTRRFYVSCLANSCGFFNVNLFTIKSYMKVRRLPHVDFVLARDALATFLTNWREERTKRIANSINYLERQCRFFVIISYKWQNLPKRKKRLYRLINFFRNSIRNKLENFYCAEILVTKDRKILGFEFLGNFNSAIDWIKIIMISVCFSCIPNFNSIDRLINKKKQIKI